MSDLVGNPEDRFSHDAAHINVLLYTTSFKDSIILVQRRNKKLIYSNGIHRYLLFCCVWKLIEKRRIW